jgi:hypothetical protein
MQNCSPYSLRNFSLSGGFFNESSATNTGAVLRLAGNVIFDAAGAVNVEGANDGSGPPKHQTIVQTGGNNAMYFRGRLHFLGKFANGSGPWSTLALTGVVDVDELLGKHGIEQHANRVVGGETGHRGYLGDDGFWNYLSGNWFFQQLKAGNTVIDPSPTSSDFYNDPPLDAQAGAWNIFIRQPNSGTATVTWPSYWQWSEGGPPALSTTNNSTDWIQVHTPDFRAWFATHVNAPSRRFTKLIGYNGNTALEFYDDPNPTNHLKVYNGGDVSLEATGTAASINMAFAVKGAGSYWFYPGAGQATTQLRTFGSLADTNFAIGTKGAGVLQVNGVQVETKGHTHTVAQVTGARSWAAVPASATATGTAGQEAYDANFHYICVGTNTWKRIAYDIWV